MTLEYPKAGRRDVSWVQAGTRLTDPYTWLEEDTPEVLAWQDAEDRVAEGQLRGWPGYRRLSELATEVAHPAKYPRRLWLPCGDRWLTRGPSGQGGQAVLLLASHDLKDVHVLYDPALKPLHTPGALEWFAASPDGRFVALGLSAGDEWHSFVHVLDVETGEILPGSAPANAHVEVAWTHDCEGFFFSWADFRGDGFPDNLWGEARVYHYALASGVATDQGLRLEGMWTPPHVSEDGRWAYVYAGSGEQRPCYLKRLDGESPWRPFLPDHEGSVVGAVFGERFIAIETSARYPRGRLVAIPLATPAAVETWAELVPMGTPIMRSPARVGDHIVVHGLRDLLTTLWIYDTEGRLVRELPMPEMGTLAPITLRPTGGWDDVLPVMADPDGRGFSFFYSTYLTSPRRLHVSIPSGEITDTSYEPVESIPDLRVHERWLTARDGARLHLFLVTRAGHDLAEPSPTLLTAYAGSRNITLPTYMGASAAFVRSGGVLVEVTIRGGGEFGRDWWLDGRRSHKQNSFNDVYDAAEFLLSAGITKRGALGFYGCSHGGMLAGTVLTQRPDLFAAVVIGGPVLDLLRLYIDPYIAWACVKEYGNPLDPAEASDVAAYSPYHAVRPEASYSPCVIICGAGDSRTRPWHGRKMAARLQEVAGRTALLRVYTGRHQGICDRAAGGPQIAEWLGFVMDHIGLMPEGAGASTTAPV